VQSRLCPLVIVVPGGGRAGRALAAVPGTMVVGVIGTDRTGYGEGIRFPAAPRVMVGTGPRKGERIGLVPTTGVVPAGPL